MTLRTISAGVLLTSTCLACNIDIPPPSYISATQIFAVRHVVELGPLHPDRVGPQLADTHETPIAEVLPGDRLRLETVVVDVDGRALADHEVETLWMQCGTGSGSSIEAQLSFQNPLPCTKLDDPRPRLGLGHTLERTCVLGTGTASFEFEVPPLDPRYSPSLLFNPPLCLYGVAAWDGRRVEDCWTSRLENNAALDRCEFIVHQVSIGPQPWLLAYIASLGVETDYDVNLFPAWVFLQPANRIPRAPELTILVDGERVVTDRPPLPTIPVKAGSRIDLLLQFDAPSQQSQLAFEPRSQLGDIFVAVAEHLYSRTATTGAIRRIGGSDPETGHDNVAVSDNGSFAYEVEEFAKPGTSRILIGYRDDRWATDFLTVKFEVR